MKIPLLFVFFFSILFSVSHLAQAVSCPVETEKAYKAPNEQAVYYITKNCTKKAFTRAHIFFTYFDSWNEVQTISEQTLNAIAPDALKFMPLGPKYDPKYGAIVKTIDDPKVYFLLGNKKFWIDSEDSFNNLRYHWNWIEDVDPRLLEKYTEGSVIRWQDGHPNYTLIKHENDAKVYRLEPDPTDPQRKVHRHITSEQVFFDLGYRIDRIVVIPKIENTPGSIDTNAAIDTITHKSRPGAPINSIADIRTIDTTVLPNTSPTQNNFFLETDTHFGFSFEYPKSWEKNILVATENSYLAEIISERSDKAQNTIGKIQIVIAQNTEKVNQETANVFLQQLFASADTQEIIELTGNKNVFSMTKIRPDQTQQKYLRSVFVYTEKYTYTFSYESNDLEYEEDLPIFEQFLNSLTFFN